MIETLDFLPISFIIILTFMCLDTLEPKLEELNGNVLHFNINKDDDQSTESSNTIDLDN